MGGGLFGQRVWIEKDDKNFGVYSSISGFEGK